MKSILMLPFLIPSRTSNAAEFNLSDPMQAKLANIEQGRISAPDAEAFKTPYRIWRNDKVRRQSHPMRDDSYEFALRLAEITKGDTFATILRQRKKVTAEEVRAALTQMQKPGKSCAYRNALNVLTLIKVLSGKGK